MSTGVKFVLFIIYIFKIKQKYTGQRFRISFNTHDNIIRFKMKTEGYSIKDLETLSGIKAHTIRIWEKRYDLLNPERTETNIRYYTDDDLKRMLNVSLLVRNGYKISKVATWNEEAIKQTVLDVAHSKNSEEGYIDQLLLFMVNFDNVGFTALVNEIIEKHGIEVAVQRIFFALFERIGTFWQVGSIFPAQEHYITNFIRQKLIAAIDALGITGQKGKTILFYLPEEELHELSLLFYSYLAANSGYNVIYLGQLVPFADLEKLRSHVELDYIFTAFISPILKEDLEDYLERLKALYRQQMVFITGRQVHEHSPKLPRNFKLVKDYREFKKYLG
ncbi:MerR family transcriptional regulator [Draconibacterium sp. IB214405]|uniref:MerR family transcriptional regulator n=1 Tax=Draconibacterium sp. IB214405 TaxID=3097352 RepID=UPI002A125DD6|nr:MerR family transcriptional regulator [Draconibacterium sp. IB214405]MDX8340340.1 MerR family transcriptional regulator [Draconibacterium sp. IB214405]